MPIDFDVYFNGINLGRNKYKMKILDYNWLKFFLKFLLKKINFIRAINEKMYKDLLILNYPKKNILKIPNGINSKEFMIVEKNYHENIHYAFVGRLVKLKNLGILLKTFNEYCSLFPYDKLFIYGVGPERDWMSNYIKENNLTKNVLLCGFEQNKYKIYKNIDVLVDTAFAQGISNSLLEAMCTNTLVVASNVAGNRDVIKHKITGLLFNLYKKDDLLPQLIYYKNNPETVKQIRINARNEILEKYDIDVITNKIYNYLKANLP